MQPDSLTRLLLAGILICLVVLVVGGSLLLAALRLDARDPPANAVAVVGLLAAAPLIVAPVASHHYHVLLAPLLWVLMGARRRAPLSSVALGVFGALALAHFVVPAARGFGLLGFGSLLVWGVVAFRQSRGRRALGT